MPIKRSFAYAGFGLKCFISYCYIICISSCKSAKQTTPACRLRLSTALYGKLHALQVKTIRADVCWWPQVSNAAGTRKAYQHRSKERLHRACFYLMAKPTNFTKIEHHFESVLIKRITVIVHIRSASTWGIKLFDTEHTLRRVSIYLPKLFFT